MATQTTADGRNILIYAELLTNLRQVTIKAVLPSCADESTQASVTADGRTLHIYHQNQTQDLVLPASVASTNSLQIPRSNTVELSWRLPVPAHELSSGHFVPEQQPLPWTSADMKTGSSISCRQCRAEIVSTDRITFWKDLPSENWAEMMEFWHCHKPVKHDDQTEDDGLTGRGYGASNAISAKPGVGFVDLISFMLSESDCHDVIYSLQAATTEYATSFEAVAAATNAKFLTITCKSCRSEVGVYSILSASVNIFKWLVLCETLVPSRLPSSSECLVAALTSTISRSGCSKSVILPYSAMTELKQQKPEPKALHLWVLNANLIYSSSSRHGPKTAVKVLYKDIDMEEANKLAESMKGDVQDITFPKEGIETARADLMMSTSLLPVSERSFQNWNVGLLERWT